MRKEERKEVVCNFSLELLNPKTVQRDISLHGSLCKGLVILVDFNQTWISSQGFSEETSVENVTEMYSGGAAFHVNRVGGRRYEEASGRVI